MFIASYTLHVAQTVRLSRFALSVSTNALWAHRVLGWCCVYIVSFAPCARPYFSVPKLCAFSRVFFSRSVCLWRRCFHFPSSAFCAARSVDEQMHYHWLLMVVCCKCVNVTTEESTQCVRQIPGILVLTIIDGVVLKRKRRQADAELFNSIYHCAINEWVVRLAWCVKYQFWNAHPPNATRKVLRKRWFNKGSSIMIWICDWI